MKVVEFENKRSKEENERKESMLEYLDYLKEMIEVGEVNEFVVCYINVSTEDATMYSTCLSTLSTLGLLEITKHIALNTYNETNN